MSDTKENIINGFDLRGAIGHYESVLLLPKDTDAKGIFISYENLFKMIQLFDFNLEQKKTRTWATPVLNNQFDFVEFREFLLYNEKCTTEEMSFILEFLAEYYTRKKAGEKFIDEE